MIAAVVQSTFDEVSAMVRLVSLASVALLALAFSAGVPAADTPATARPTVLITGANRGIGFEFARQLAARDWRVIATARQPAEAADLNRLAAGNPDIIVEALDVTDHPAIDRLAARYRNQPIDLLLLNAAMGPSSGTALNPVAKLGFDEARRSFEVNAIGPLKIVQAFLDAVAASDRKLIVALSSDSGSLEASVKRPFLYHYRASKAALNMYMHTLSFETPRKGITVVMLHPGAVKTNEAMKRFPGALETPDSVSRMLTVIDGLTPADNGRFLDYRGETMPW